MVFRKLFRYSRIGELETGRNVDIASMRKARPRATGPGLHFRTGKSAVSLKVVSGVVGSVNQE